MPPVHSLAWRFGGPLAGLPPVFAWTLLALAGLLGAAWIVVSYRRTLVALAPGPRRILVGLRLALWTGLLIALAGPVRVERIYAKKEIRPLALLVDRSASMTTPDNRRQRRADDALRRWRALAPAASAAHGPPRPFAFADTAEPATLAAPDAELGLPSGQTRLFASLDHLLATAPPGGWGGIVALTDALDTTAEDPSAALDATTRAALATGTPLYLLPGRNRHSGAPLLVLRDLLVPSQVPPRSTFRFEITLDTYQPVARDIPLQLRVGDTWREPETVRLEAGRRALTWGVDLDARSTGVMPLELRVGQSSDAVVARAEVRVATPASTRILYYQGALDWGYRHLADILRRDPAFTLTPIFNLAPDGVRARLSGAAPSATLPDTAAGYQAYDVVILANTIAAQFTPAQQAALSSWTRDGGVVLFLSPDDASTRGFAGSELEKMLPVVFAPPGADAGEDARIADFRAQIRRSGGSHMAAEHDFAANAALSSRQPPLSAFVWEPRALTLLGPELSAAVPRFAHYARVRRAKPGADILARHPVAPGPEGEGNAILLAIQRYGRGQSAILASDALWRWKLNQPSRERGAEKFWQNLLAWLGRERVSGARFERAPLQAQTARELILRVVGADTGLAVTATLEAPGPSPSDASLIGNHKSEVLFSTALFPAGEDSGARLYRWTPPAEGLWVLSARGAGDAPSARHWIDVRALPTGENSGLPPDEAVLRSLADRTGGAILADAPPPAWREAATAPSAATLLRETARPLWHQGWIFATLLLLYATELVLRRRSRLL